MPVFNKTHNISIAVFVVVLFNKLQEDKLLISVPDSHDTTLMREPRKTKTGQGKEEGIIITAASLVESEDVCTPLLYVFVISLKKFEVKC